eukprot:2123617-Pyramimonas_sp.AAC.1
MATRSSSASPCCCWSSRGSPAGPMTHTSIPPYLKSLSMWAPALLESLLTRARCALAAMFSRYLERSVSIALASCGEDPRQNASAVRAISSSWTQLCMMSSTARRHQSKCFWVRHGLACADGGGAGFIDLVGEVEEVFPCLEVLAFLSRRRRLSGRQHAPRTRMKAKVVGCRYGFMGFALSVLKTLRLPRPLAARGCSRGRASPLGEVAAERLRPRP